jgi:phosphatidylglycerophosphatase C
MRTGNSLALFDFDGTITKKDTLFQFTRFFVGSRRYFLGLIILSIPLALHRFSLINAQKAKEIFLSHFYKNIQRSDFQEKCVLFSRTVLPKSIRPKALEALENHKKLGSHIYIVSASPHNWIQPWANQFNIDVIGTKLEIKDERLTGKILGLNCNGLEKVNRIKEIINLNQFDKIIAYGDSTGDIAMMNLAHQKFYKPFR